MQMNHYISFRGSFKNVSANLSIFTLGTSYLSECLWGSKQALPLEVGCFTGVELRPERADFSGLMDTVELGLLLAEFRVSE